MSERRFRVLVVVSHPIQYAVPVFRLLAQNPQLDFEVAYCTLRGAEAAYDPEFGRRVQWDVPQLDGSKWTHVPNLQTFRPPFLPVLLAFLWYAAMQIFNPGSTSIFYGLLGMKLYFYYFPLVFVGYAIINSETDLRKFFNINLGMMLVIALLGIAQSIVGPRFLNPEAMAPDIRLLSETYRVSAAGVRVYRPTSVFVSTGRFSDFLIVAWLLIFGFSGYLLLRHRRGRLFAFLALAATAAACVMCMSRSVFSWSIIGAVVGGAAFIWGAPWRQGEALRAIRALQRAALGIGLAIVVMLFAYPDAFLGRLAVYSETLDPRSPNSELVHRGRDYPLHNFLAAFDYPRWPYGYGIGTVSLGGQYVSRIFHAKPPVGIIAEGVDGFVLADPRDVTALSSLVRRLYEDRDLDCVSARMQR